MFDVGQGDALLVEGARSAVLVDAGRAIAGGMDLGRSVVVPGLAALGVEALDVVVVTHADLDHRGGIPAVLEAVPVGELWLPWQGSVDPAFGEVLRVARRRGVEIVETGRGGAARRIGDAVVTPLWPPRHGPPPAAHGFDNLAEHSPLQNSPRRKYIYNCIVMFDFITG